jgi:hypothetical protein
MSQFRPFLPFEQISEVDVVEDKVLQDARVTTEPLRTITGEVDAVEDGELQDARVTTEPLELIVDRLSNITVAESLTTTLQATMSPKMAERIVIIPGRTSPKASTSSRKMSLRLRQGLVLGSLLLVGIISLLSLSPLASGEYGIPIFKNISNWFQMQQTMWQLQAQNQAETTPKNLPAPPPVTLPNSPYVAVAELDAVNAGIPPAYFVRQINQESLFNPSAVSPAGAVGIAQFMPGTAATLGIDPWNPTQALQGAAHLMASYVKQYGGNYAMALAAYNAGIGAVQYAVNYCGSYWMNCLPAETRNYIYVIMGI